MTIHAGDVESFRPLANLEFRRLLEKLPAAAYTCDAGGRITYFNERALQLWGRQPQLNSDIDRYCGSFLLFTTEGVSVPHEECWMALALRHNQEYNGHEIVIELADGSRRVAAAYANPLHDEQGQLVGAVNVLVDITDRKRAERGLAERNRLTAARADVSAAMAARQSAASALQDCCRGLVRQLRLQSALVWTLDEKSSELELQAFCGSEMGQEPLFPSRIALTQQPIGRIALEGKAYHCNAIATDDLLSGQLRAWEPLPTAFAGYPLLAEGRVLGVLGLVANEAFSELTVSELASTAEIMALSIDRKQAEERLREETRITETLHRIGGLLAAQLDLDKLVQAVTDEATKLTEAEFGAFFYNTQDEDNDCYRLYSLSGVSKETFARFPMPNKTSTFAPTFAGTGPIRLDDVTRDPRHDPHALETELPHGQLPVKSYLAVPVVSRSGEPLGGLFFGHSRAAVFTARHESLAVGIAAQAAIAIDNARLYQQACAQAQQLQAADRRKDDFLAMLAHELRNPLVPIRSGLDVLAMDAGVHRETVGVMQEQVEHVVRLVDDLLDVSRIMRAKVELRKELVLLSALVKQAVQTVSPLIDAQRHQLTVHLPAQPIWLYADPVRLMQVLQNLLNNASKYMDPGGRIELVVECVDGQAVISVRDSGVGIEAELLPNVFELFTQSSRSLDRAQGGLGIGLTLVQRLVQMHEGTVSAASEGPGQGSTFTVRLPVAEAVGHAKAIEAQPPATPSRRVLIVDDNRSARWLLSQLLAKLGNHEIRTAQDGTSALAAIQDMHPEIVLLDIGLPGMDGYQVGAQLRSMHDFDDVLLVALTGYGQAEDRLKSQQAGFDEHLVKPPSVSQLRAVLAHAKLALTSQT